MKLSIIIPVYNEEKTIEKILHLITKLVIPNVQKEIIVIDDGSTDNSKSIIKDLKLNEIKFFVHNKNMGKAAAIKTALQYATGDYIIIQDADTEYNPADIVKLVKHIKTGEESVVYGTRLDRLPDVKNDGSLLFLHYFGNRFLSLLTSILYGQWITDMETCYKLFPRNAVKHMQLHAKGFAFEPEITAKLLKAGYKITEVPITTVARSYNEGKKLQAWKDGPIALWSLIKYRFVD